MIIDHKQQDEYLELLRQDKIPLGLGIGCDFDNHIRYKPGSFNIILGHANVGKTYWVLWYLLCLGVIHKHKALIYSAENTVQGLKRNLIELLAGRKIVGMTQEELNNHKQQIESMFDFVDSQKLWTIDDFMKEVQKLGRYDTIMIDPHNSFQKPKGVNAHEHDYATASKLRLFAKKFKTTIYLCTHAATEALRKTHRDGDFQGQPVPPSPSDAEGGGKWVNRADDFIVLHRYTQDASNWMYTHCHVKKVKETETGGKPTLYDDPVRFKLVSGTSFEVNGINPIKAVESPLEGFKMDLTPNLDFDKKNDVPF